MHNHKVLDISFSFSFLLLFPFHSFLFHFFCVLILEILHITYSTVPETMQKMASFSSALEKGIRPKQPKDTFDSDFFTFLLLSLHFAIVYKK